MLMLTLAIVIQVARGNTVLTLHNPDVGKKTQDMVVFALKKFTGLLFRVYPLTYLSLKLQ